MTDSFNIDKSNTLADFIKQRAQSKQKGITIVFDKKNDWYFSYQQIYTHALHILYGLQQKGVKPGDEIILPTENIAEFIIIFWACILGGFVAVPVTTKINDSQRVFNIWSALTSPRAVMSNHLFDQMQRRLMKTNEAIISLSQLKKQTILVDDLTQTDHFGKINSNKTDDIAFIQFTSGSIGKPKGVVLTHGNIVSDCVGMIGRLGLTSDDKTFNWMPLSHDMGMIIYHIMPFVFGCHQIHMNTSLFIKRPWLWMTKAQELKATILGGPNFSLHYFVERFESSKAVNWSLTHIRMLLCGAEPISINVVDRFNKLLSGYGFSQTAIKPGYGLAEASVVVALAGPKDRIEQFHLDRNRLNIGERVRPTERDGSNTITFVGIGPTIDCCDVIIAGENDEILEEDTIGHIRIKGENVTQGYYKNPQDTSKMIKNGWVDTGDLGFMHNRTLVITGRSKNIIIVKGQNYYAHDIEEINLELDGVELNKIVACGSFNEELGKDEIIIFVKYKKDLASFVPLAERIKRHSNMRLAIRVDHVIPVKNIPKTTSGKLQRSKLLNEFKDGIYDDKLNEIELMARFYHSQKKIIMPEDALEAKIRSIWANVLTVNPTEIGTDEPFMSIGGTSFKANQMLFLLEQALNLDLGQRLIVECETIKQIAEYIENHTGQSQYAVEVVQ